MRVKVGDTWYDPKDQPIAVELTEYDKNNIALMLTEARMYAEWAPGYFENADAAHKWMLEKGQPDGEH